MEQIINIVIWKLTHIYDTWLDDMLTEQDKTRKSFACNFESKLKWIFHWITKLLNSFVMNRCQGTLCYHEVWHRWNAVNKFSNKIPVSFSRISHSLFKILLLASCFWVRHFFGQNNRVVQILHPWGNLLENAL